MSIKDKTNPEERDIADKAIPAIPEMLDIIEQLAAMLWKPVNKDELKLLAVSATLLLNDINGKKMSKQASTATLAIQYSAATGLLVSAMQYLLLEDGFTKEEAASLIVKNAEPEDELPASILKLKQQLKKKYNL